MTRHFIIGDHLVTPQSEGHHHGLFVGHDQVIQCLPPAPGKHSGQLALTSLAQFSQHCAIEVKPHAQRLFSREESLTRATPDSVKESRASRLPTVSCLSLGVLKGFSIPPSCCRPL